MERVFVRGAGVRERRVEELLRARGAALCWPGWAEVPMELVRERYGMWAEGVAQREWECGVVEELLAEGLVAGGMRARGDELLVGVMVAGAPGDWDVAEMLVARQLAVLWREAQESVAPEELAGPEVREELREEAVRLARLG